MIVDYAHFKAFQPASPNITAQDARSMSAQCYAVVETLRRDSAQIRRSKERGASRRAKCLDEKADRFLVICRELDAAATEAEQAALMGRERGLPFRTELTRAGEQFVIPGCERNAAPARRQLDLFG